uniref:Uncharacterized protein n=1 Tax=Tanacetum cinerariifolium TaxID=118510 RepID=A0A6L2NRF7_TANCI|nr:hypothetical protein [Tanacetum cinerariifolium]
MIADIDEDVEVYLEEAQAKAYNSDLQHSEKVHIMQDINEEQPIEMEEVLEVVTTAKLITEVVTIAEPTTTVAQVPKVSAARRRMGVVIHDPEETAASVIVYIEVQSKDKGKGILIEEPKPLKGQAQIKQDEAFARIDEVSSAKEKPLTEAPTRKNMMVYLKNMAGFKMNIFKGEEEVTIQEKEIKEKEATPLASKVLVVDYQIDNENNKLYYRIIKADGSHKLFLSFITLLKNFNREDLETLWNLVKERFETTKPKNFSDEYLLNVLKIMFEKPNIEANIFLPVDKKYPLTHLTLDQMLNNVRFKVEEESEMSLELLCIVSAVSQEVLEVVTAAKLITEVVTIAEPTTSVEPTTTAAQVPKVSAPRRRRERKHLKGQAQIKQDEAFARQLEAELNANINWNDVLEKVKRSERQNNALMSEIRTLFEKHYNLNQAFLERVEEVVTIQEKEIEEECNKRQEATPLASKVPVVNYQIHHENNKSYYKIIRGDGSHKLFLSFITLLKNVDREDLETLWNLDKERFGTTEPKNFSDKFLLNILKIMFVKPNIDANVRKDQNGIYVLAKVKSWKLFESCRIHIITFTTTQMFPLVEKKYPLTHFTLEQMINNI